MKPRPIPVRVEEPAAVVHEVARLFPGFAGWKCGLAKSYHQPVR